MTWLIIASIFAVVWFIAFNWVRALGNTGSNKQVEPKPRVTGVHNPETTAHCLADLQRRQSALNRSARKIKSKISVDTDAAQLARLGRTADDWKNE